MKKLFGFVTALGIAASTTQVDARYLEADPLGLVDGPSVYGYAGQNPGRYIDPRGEYKETGLPASEGTGIGPPADDPCGCVVFLVGTTAAAPAIVAGQPITPKRFVTKGSSGGSSPISSYLNKKFPTPMKKSRWAPTTRVPSSKTKVLGKFAGRWVPIAGWGVLAVDIGLYWNCLENCKGCYDNGEF